MSAKTKFEALNKYRANRREALGNIALVKAVGYTGRWNDLTEEAKAEKLHAVTARAYDEQGANLEKIRADIAAEVVEARRAIDAIKYPLSMSTGTFDRQAGQTQQTNAMLFLNTRPTAERILTEVRNRLDRGEIDFAFTIKDNCLNDVERIAPGVLKPNSQQDILMKSIDEAFSAYKGTAKIKEGEAELEEYAKAERIAANFYDQHVDGARGLVNAELWPYVSEQDRADMTVDWTDLDRPLAETVSLKRRAHDAMWQKFGDVSPMAERR